MIGMLSVCNSVSL